MKLDRIKRNSFYIGIDRNIRFVNELSGDDCFYSCLELNGLFTSAVKCCKTKTFARWANAEVIF